MPPFFWKARSFALDRDRQGPKKVPKTQRPPATLRNALLVNPMARMISVGINMNCNEQKAILYKLSLKGVSIQEKSVIRVHVFQGLDGIGIFIGLQVDRLKTEAGKPLTDFSLKPSAYLPDSLHYSSFFNLHIIV
jgi:hypothetical protein